MTNRQDDELVQAMISKLDKSMNDLAPSITEKLNQARFCALEAGLGAQDENDIVSNILRQLEKNEALPAEIERKLNQIRRKAIGQNIQGPVSITDKIKTFYQFALGANYRLTAGMAATACLTLTVAALFYNSPTTTNTLPLDPNIGLIASADELELYENLDFYVWLAENEVLP